MKPKGILGPTVFIKSYSQCTKTDGRGRVNLYRICRVSLHAHFRTGQEDLGLKAGFWKVRTPYPLLNYGLFYRQSVCRTLGS